MKRILIVEDTIELAEALQNSLEREGYSVAIATRAAQAGALAASHRPDLVVLDLGLPDRDGYSVLEQLRSRGDDAPVLILSARRDEADKLQGFRLGADDYVTKPFGAMELLARIAALLRRHERTCPGAGKAPAAPAAAPAAPAAAPAALPDEALRERFGLTPRQIDVARLIGEGLTNAEIAEKLGLSFFTVRAHTEQVLAKLAVPSRAGVGALLYAG
ncbi:response regulator [Longimicrobium terrae]|uniref:DNA-binding response OmpR family regulator n=1 Tax=Longimicrobium terrae TaxID=1639882 RepID=A0A841H2Y5_9BACT|nr:response regulator [Longimicrobium terrae]MBB4637962.1 DNA-binding response OmpR family regulator [Longimicrobium terrae]MBB6072209.1 DNA-binding response OmpR family regulator [Longimicrobium terrae]NNC28365.1 response regulator [Longimicrobium terrae]